MEKISLAFVILGFLFSILIAGCLGQKGQANQDARSVTTPRQNTDSINGLSFTPPQGFTKAGEGKYILKNGTAECILNIAGIPINPSNSQTLDDMGAKIKSNMEAQGFQVTSMGKMPVNSYDAIRLNVVAGDFDQTQYIIKFRNNYAVVAYGIAPDCASSMEEILQTLTSVAEQS